MRFHPRREGVMAVASARNFGLKGPGCLQIYHQAGQPSSQLQVPDALFSVAWSELDDHRLVGAMANGQMALFDGGIQPLLWHAHGKEVSHVDWSALQTQLVLSASWEGAVKVWAMEQAGAPRLTHTQTISAAPLYQARWHPREASLYAAVGAEGRLTVHDLRLPTNNIPSQVIGIPGGECLCFDWNKYEGMTVATGSVDGTIRLWDLRTGKTLQIFSGHSRAVKDLCWSPWSADDLLSASLDMTCRRWSRASLNPLLWMDQQPTEFVTSVDWSLRDPRLIAYAAWDQRIRLHRFSNHNT